MGRNTKAAIYETLLKIKIQRNTAKKFIFLLTIIFIFQITKK